MSIKPRLNVFDMTMITIGLVIGVAIYKVPGSVAANSGNSIAFMSIWVFGGLISMIGALIFAEIGARIQAAGGFYKLFSITYAPLFSFILNWAIILTNAATVSATLLIGAESLLKVVFGINIEIFQIKIVSFISCVVILLLNLTGIKPAAIIEDILSLIKILLILVLGATVIIAPSYSYGAPMSFDNNSINFVKIFSLGFVPVFYAFNGYNNTVNFGADLQMSKQNMPRSIIIGMSIVLFLYILINLSYVLGLGYENLKLSEFPLIDLTQKYYGDYGKNVVGFTIYLTVLGFVNAAFINNPRMYYAMSEDKVLPDVFKRINPSNQVQTFSVITFFILVTASLVFSKSFESIVKFVILIKGISLVFASISLVLLRKRDKEYKGFKVKLLYLILPVYVSALLLVMIVFSYNNQKESIYSGLILLTGVPLFYYCQRTFRHSDHL